MIKIDSTLIEQACYELCIEANTNYNNALYEIINSMYCDETDSYKKNKLYNILKNVQIASEKKRPLCQDTGQVIVFAYIGQNVQITGENINNAINEGIKKAYTQNYYRKSVVEDALFNRDNTNTNTPAIIYTEIRDNDFIELKMMIKGAGSENYSALQMLKPTSKQDEIFEFVKTSLKQAGEKACPPYVLGIGIGGTAEKALLMSKEAFFVNNLNAKQTMFKTELREYLKNSQIDILDIKIKTAPTHIACLPVGITINCHSCRHSECKITDEKIILKENKLKIKEIKNNTKKLKEINTNNLEEMKKLEIGEEILLSGEIYTARDAAHEKLKKDFEQNKKLPINLKDKIIFYAGPCPPCNNEIIGPIGPTTSTRMDKYTKFICKNGVIATIGKGERTQETKQIIKEYKARYFSAQGGIACLLANCVKNSEIIAYKELGTEAIRKLIVEKLPLKVEI